MASKALPSQEVLRQLLDYDPETGALTWRERGVEWFTAKAPARSSALCRLWNTRYAGEAAFTCLNYGYLTGALFGGNFKAQRVIWKMVYGVDPDQIDHINGVRSDNRLANLRNVNQSENMRNRCLSTNNITGLIGIYRWAHRGFVYWAVTTPEKRSSTYFHCIGQAIRARKDAERRLGFHANHGRAA